MIHHNISRVEALGLRLKLYLCTHNLKIDFLSDDKSFRQCKKEVIELMDYDGFNFSKDFVRVGVKSGGCSGLSYDLTFDHIQRDNDTVFEDNEVKIIVDKKSFLYLVGTTLEYSGGLNGKGFVFNNPMPTERVVVASHFHSSTSLVLTSITEISTFLTEVIKSQLYMDWSIPKQQKIIIYQMVSVNLDKVKYTEDDLRERS